ncbi:CLUMA_CG019420, isoform A [Clunio marinus]|uniref:CLUMA_CG019420, isoform A n=1 Tax=Clunio marinus TaxID=568069 RepID=A0A1J1J0H3_9DIPT|nr:CLUMA_CG019420, isoform A [Clunio marinus]
MENHNNQKIYRINSTRTNFIYTSDTPEEDTNIVYNSFYEIIKLEKMSLLNLFYLHITIVVDKGKDNVLLS